MHRSPAIDIVPASVASARYEPRMERLHVIDFDDVRRKIVPYSHEPKQTTRELLDLITDASVDKSQAMSTRCISRIQQRCGEITHWEHHLEELVTGAVRDFPQRAEHSDVAPQLQRRRLKIKKRIANNQTEMCYAQM